MKQNPQGISAKSKKGKHITEICPEITDKYWDNYRRGVKECSKRRIQGNYTQKELEGYKKIAISQTGSRNNRAAKIVCNETGQKFGSMSEAVKFYGLNSRTPIQTTIRTNKQSKHKNIKGLSFRYQ